MRRIASLVVAIWLTAAGVAHAEGGAAAEGESLFSAKCTACHSIGGGARVGPDLQGVTARRSHEWLARFIAAPDQLIAAKDPIVVELLGQYNQIAMPNLGLTEDEVGKVIAYLAESGTAPPAAAPRPAVSPMAEPERLAPQSTILVLFLALTAVITIVFAAVASSTRAPAAVDVERAYALRRVLFFTGVTVVTALLVATIPLAPYVTADARADRVVYVAARQYDFVFSDEPITSAADLAQVPRISHLEIPAGTLVEFRVTSLDVTHGFGLYGPERQIIAQTQAMPGYFNRLLLRLDAPAQYHVFCLEYCASGHHLMRADLTVK